MFLKALRILGLILLLPAVGLDAQRGGHGPPPSTPPPNVPPGPPTFISAPEFDGRTSGTAIALLVGGVVVLVERRRRAARARRG